MPINPNPIYTIGHSNHSIERFVDYLAAYKIDAVVDVRSNPHSRHISHFDRKPLAAQLRGKGIKYGWLGDQLGARRNERECYVDGQASYGKIVQLESFQKGIERILQGNRDHVIAIMCTERDPLDCHRTILVCRELKKYGLTIRHILADGTVEEHIDTEKRLVKLTRLVPDLFIPTVEATALIAEAYEAQGNKIAFSEAPEIHEGV